MLVLYTSWCLCAVSLNAVAVNVPMPPLLKSMHAAVLLDGKLQLMQFLYGSWLSKNCCYKVCHINMCAVLLLFSKAVSNLVFDENCFRWCSHFYFEKKHLHLQSWINLNVVSESKSMIDSSVGLRRSGTGGNLIHLSNNSRSKNNFHKHYLIRTDHMVLNLLQKICLWLYPVCC